MRTAVVDGVELTVYIEQGDLLSLHLDQLAVVRFNLARLRHFDIFGHASLLHSLNFPGRDVLSGIGEDPRLPSGPAVWDTVSAPLETLDRRRIHSYFF